MARQGSKSAALLGGLALIFFSCSTPPEEAKTVETVTEAEPVVVVEASLLELAQDAWFIYKDPQLTEHYIDLIDKNTLADESERTLFQLLCRKVYSRVLELESMGSNISSLYLDKDDLWMGTWGGGVYRYSIPLDDLIPFKQDRNSLRVEILYDFERVNNEIHMAGYSDLYTYDRGNSRFTHTYPEEMERINDLEFLDETLYASTIGQGLWFLDRLNRWKPLKAPLISKQINLLFEDYQGNLLIGTASSGVVVYHDGQTYNLKRDYPGFQARNINSFSENGRFLVVGTYGEGVYLLDKTTKESYHYNKEKGDLLSDYILCSIFDEGQIYLGSLGGGISVLSTGDFPEQEWVNIGMSEGLLSLDVVSLVIYNSQIYAANLGQGVIVFDDKIVQKAL